MIYTDDKERAILDECQRHPGVSEYLLIKATGLNKITLAVYLRELGGEGLINRQGKGYAIAQELLEDEEPAQESCFAPSSA
jgi:predicted transcriptional regulator